MIEAGRTEGGVYTITINRPNRANSLTKGMLQDLCQAVDEAKSSAARAVILTGSGDKVFSAGADLEEAKAGLATDPVWEALSSRIAALDGPSIAALNGTLAGGAFGMALACDIRLAVPGAKFFYPVAKLGFLPQPPDPGRLARLVGPGRAKILLLAAETISTDEALAWGLVDRVVARSDLMSAARMLCAAAIEGNANTLGKIKAMVDEAAARA
ncbi:MAG: enoyl-CoA hydratase/isomerase family protein [Pseudomonadota bacterium]